MFAVLGRLNRDARHDDRHGRASRRRTRRQGFARRHDGSRAPSSSTARRGRLLPQGAIVHSEEAAAVPTASWFPQVAEFAMDLAAASGRELTLDKVALSVDEAVALCVGAGRRAAAAQPPRRRTCPSAHESRCCRSTRCSFGYEQRRARSLRASTSRSRPTRSSRCCGRNGSGKTTLARLLWASMRRRRGRSALEGKDLAELGAARDRVRTSAMSSRTRTTNS